MNHHIRRRRVHPRGFTLIEMLISVTLVLLMMSLFATVFVYSTTALATQKGVAENDQRGRMLSITLRSDLDGRTFRDLLPFRSEEDTTQPSKPISRRSGYFEIDEGDPNDDTDDVLQFTVSTNLPNVSANGTKFIGRTDNLTSQPINVIGGSSTITISNTLPSGSTFDFATVVSVDQYIWISGSSYVDASGNHLTYDGRYQIAAPAPPTGQTNTVITLSATLPAYTTLGSRGNVLLSELDPDFDDGQIGNGLTASTFAEVCYFLRNGVLYRRTLPIRDSQSGSSAQPQWNNGQLLATSPGLVATTFWNEYDCSAFYPPTTTIASPLGSLTTSYSPSSNAVFHDAADSLSNSYISDPTVLASVLSLGLPFQRFGHSITNGLPQDASTYATVNGQPTSVVRFNIQECANSNFGYPGTIVGGNPFDSQSLVVETTAGTNYGLVTAYEGQLNRRGQDILLTNVLSFDIKVWDPINGFYVDIGSSTPIGGPFSVMPYPTNIPAGFAASTGATVYTGTVQTSPGSVNVSGYTDGVLYNIDSTGTPTIIGGRLNSTYGSNPQGAPYGVTPIPASFTNFSPDNNRYHFRFDTWHPDAAINANAVPSVPANGGFYNQPPYFQWDSPSNANSYLTNSVPTTTTGYTYTEAPFVPAGLLTSGQFHAFPISSIQITINYRDVSSKQIRSMTLVESMIDRVQAIRSFQSVNGSVSVPTLD